VLRGAFVEELAAVDAAACETRCDAMQAQDINDVPPPINIHSPSSEPSRVIGGAGGHVISIARSVFYVLLYR